MRPPDAPCLLQSSGAFVSGLEVRRRNRAVRAWLMLGVKVLLGLACLACLACGPSTNVATGDGCYSDDVVTKLTSCAEECDVVGHWAVEEDPCAVWIEDAEAGKAKESSERACMAECSGEGVVVP